MDNPTVDRLSNVCEQISASARNAGRKQDSVRLVAVSKTVTAERIIPVLKAGQRIFGENRVQEAIQKWPGLRDKFPDIELHLIGPLQSNKTQEAVTLFDVIQTVDRPKIAASIAKEITRTGRTPRLLVQVNTGEEPQKAGVVPAELEKFVCKCQQEYGLAIEGLMCIPPQNEEAALHFALLEKYARELGLPEISMGMSADFAKAVTFGATCVRVGSAIFGARQTSVTNPEIRLG
jgi:pyridoxal phosphate enzyme (YggS family)